MLMPVQSLLDGWLVLTTYETWGHHCWALTVIILYERVWYEPNVCDMTAAGDMQKVVYAVKNKVQFNYKHMQRPTMCYKTKPDSVTDVCVWRGGGTAVGVCKLCLQLSSKAHNPDQYSSHSSSLKPCSASTRQASCTCIGQFGTTWLRWSFHDPLSFLATTEHSFAVSKGLL